MKKVKILLGAAVVVAVAAASIASYARASHVLYFQDPNNPLAGCSVRTEGKILDPVNGTTTIATTQFKGVCTTTLVSDIAD